MYDRSKVLLLLHWRSRFFLSPLEHETSRTVEVDFSRQEVTALDRLSTVLVVQHPMQPFPFQFKMSEDQTEGGWTVLEATSLSCNRDWHPGNILRHE